MDLQELKVFFDDLGCCFVIPSLTLCSQNDFAEVVCQCFVTVGSINMVYFGIDCCRHKVCVMLLWVDTGDVSGRFNVIRTHSQHQ